MQRLVFSTPLGWMALEAGAHGIVRLSIGMTTEHEARAKLDHDLEIIALDDEVLPQHAPQWLDGAIATLRDYANGAAVDPTKLPLEDARGTDFQRRVVRACRGIPRGETATYGEVAAEAGSPGAARAVGRVMATNQIPLAIPCHRVVGSTGLHGFSAPGGLETKRKLLRLEGAI